MNDVKRKLAGRYELAEVIGRGGMGAVYRAVDLVLGRTVAVKLLPGTLADQDPTSVARFEREARAAAALNHPAVVAVYDAGADETARFIVMELISGRSLEAIVRDEGQLDPDRATRITVRVADALAAAHAAGIVHRDIKPANVMIAADGSVKVLDFGIARAMDSATLTQTASVVGTAAYMSPEQALGKPADARSDIYSLGCVLYTLLAGHPPFSGDGPAAILNQHANVPPGPLDTESSRVSSELNALVVRMLAKSPEQRPQTAAEVCDRLSLSSATPALVPATPALVPATPPLVPSVTAWTKRLGQTIATWPLPPVVRLHRHRPIVAGVLAALVLVIALVALAPGGGSRHAGTRTLHRAKASRATSPTTRSRTTPSASPVASSSDTTSSTSPGTRSGAAGALTALTTHDVRSGVIDQQAAQQITSALSDTLDSYAQGHTNDIQHKLADLSQHIADLQRHGDIRSVAAPDLNRAVVNLGSAFGASPPSTTQASGASSPDQPVQSSGDGGQPPAKAQDEKAKGH